MGQQKKDLLLVCNKFPYGFGEAFLEAEFPFLYDAFQKIVILTITDQENQTRKIPSDVTQIRKPKTLSFKEKIQTAFYILAHLKSFFQLIVHEIKAREEILRTNKHLDFGRKYLHFIPIIENAFKAFNLKQYFKKNALPHIQNNSMLYAYWQDYTALSITLIKKEIPAYKAICRTHGGDLYFYRNKYSYLPFRRFISENMNRIFFISKNGLDYQSNLLGKEYLNYSLARLGTKKVQELTNKNKLNGYRIVSCSNIISIKRIDLIINALSKIPNKRIEWIHFGGGVLKEKMESLAKELLSDKPNISYTFRGNVKNAELHRYYAQNKISLFINVSESEGIPVSIMEAMSYGVPAIATNVGGTGELVDNTCGLLIDKDVSGEQLTQFLKRELDEKKLRKKDIYAIKKWETNFQAEKNFKEFVHFLGKP
ncbi:glycosyltransferase [Maribellus mangrovi]|uniref:glycosyltransferase n=1 Tax=Maribellus mangrovi TaxID=3133146 RepID=UPI0030EF390C